MGMFNQTMLGILFHFARLKWIFTKTDGPSSRSIFKTFLIFPYAVYNHNRMIDNFHQKNN